jgi:hypothetical protein
MKTRSIFASYGAAPLRKRPATDSKRNMNRRVEYYNMSTSFVADAVIAGSGAEATGASYRQLETCQH